MAFPLIAWMAATLGWRHVFWILGGVGIAWALVWTKVIRNRPEQHPRVGEYELVHITEDEATADSSAQSREKGAFRRDMGFLLRQRRIWGVFLGQFAIASTLYFFLTWFPTYLTNERGLSLDKGGLTGALPFVAANYVTSNAAMIAIMCVAFFANGLASFSWVLVTEIAPERMLGVAGGVFNVFGNLAGIVVPIVIGYMIGGGDGSFALPLMLIAGITIGGALSSLFLVDQVERIEA
ncbi:MFS transporter [Streptomyces sp. NBC_00347]|uniref:MFS transporter n=1 Tax=Streptomyces sp. NBC_00347 TaxID=2975721 RepID=UPI00224E145E|nr:MFS transporter [Streptomyces sp. NBC_00347]MCX5125566.1 MFS transporter [Streptomyces sp. NBC_00347]